MKYRVFLFTLAALLFATTSRAQKTVYIPKTFNQVGADDYCNKNGKNGTITSKAQLKDSTERWCASRSYETDNLICFWEPGFGTDPAKLKNPANTSQTFDIRTYMAVCDNIMKYHIDVLKATPANGTNLNKYKFLFLLSYTTNWIAYGGGYDYVIGAMWLNPAAMGVGSAAVYPYFVLGHELFHSMSYQCYSDRPGSTYRAFQDAFNGPFWERSANFAASQLYPNVNNDFARYMYATNSHFLNTRKHYTTSFFLENLTQTKGKSAIGNIWRNNQTNEHAMVTIRRVFFDNNQAKLNDFFAQTAMKNMTWDYAAGTNALYYKTVVNSMTYNTDLTANVDVFNTVMKKHRTILQAVDFSKLHFAVQDCQAPQDYAYNAIQLFPQAASPDGTYSFKIHFKGHSEADDTYKKSGWRWGVVAVQSNGIPRYGTIHAESDGTISVQSMAGDKEFWLVVTGAPSEHNSYHNYTWEAGLPKYYRYPYEVRFENALPMGYNADYEGAKTSGKAHVNGGGWVATTAKVAATAYVGPNAKVLGTATVSDSARIEDFAIVKGAAKVSGNARVRENAMVFSNASVYENAVISGCARVFNNSSVYGNAMVTDNAYIYNTKVYGDAIACGNLWQRDNNCEIGGTCVAGGDSEYMGFIATGDAVSGAEVKGTFLQWPENANNKRTRKDGLGNLTTTQLNTLKTDWNNIRTRFSILNNSISTLTSNPNYDINKPYDHFNTDTAMSMDNALSDSWQSALVLNDAPDGAYFIRNAVDSTVLTYDNTSVAKFKPMGTTVDVLKNQYWKLTKDTTGRYSIRFYNADTIYINQTASIQKSGYVPTYHTFNLYHKVGTESFTIQRAGSGGTNFWGVTSNTSINGAGTAAYAGQPFILQQVVPLAVNGPSAVRKCMVYPTLCSTTVTIELPEGISQAEVHFYDMNGKNAGSLKLNESLTTLDISTLPTGVLLGRIRAAGFNEAFKVIHRQ